MRKLKPYRYLFLILLTLFIVSCGKANENDTDVLKPIDTATYTPSPTEEVINTPAITDSITETPAFTCTPSLTETPVPTASSTPIPATPTPISHDNDVRSKLTGMWIPNEYANYRPYGVMINNIHYAAPQSGISSAGVLIEALVEGQITRFMAIYDASQMLDSNCERIGSVRSLRHYYISFAQDFDAISVHFGQTVYATEALNNLKTDDIDGITSSIAATVFYRDENIQSPHNVFFSLKSLINKVLSSSMRTTYYDGYDGNFKFSEEDYSLSSSLNATDIIVKFSDYCSPEFIYNEETMMYTRYQFKAVHTDANNGESLNFKNIIIQFVNEWNKDSNGYQTMELENTSGSGYYITNGKAIKIKWIRNESAGYMKYQDENGDELVLNPGKIYLGVCPNYNADKLVIK